MTSMRMRVTLLVDDQIDGGGGGWVGRWGWESFDRPDADNAAVPSHPSFYIHHYYETTHHDDDDEDGDDDDMIAS